MFERFFKIIENNIFVCCEIIVGIIIFIIMVYIVFVNFVMLVEVGMD